MSQGASSVSPFRSSQTQLSPQVLAMDYSVLETPIVPIHQSSIGSFTLRDEVLRFDLKLGDSKVLISLCESAVASTKFRRYDGGVNGIIVSLPEAGKTYVYSRMTSALYELMGRLRFGTVMQSSDVGFLVMEYSYAIDCAADFISRSFQRFDMLKGTLNANPLGYDGDDFLLSEQGTFVVNKSSLATLSAFSCAIMDHKIEKVIVCGGGGNPEFAMSMVRDLAKRPSIDVSIVAAYSAGTMFWCLKRARFGNGTHVQCHMVQIDSMPSSEETHSMLESFRQVVRNFEPAFCPRRFSAWEKAVRTSVKKVVFGSKYVDVEFAGVIRRLGNPT